MATLSDTNNVTGPIDTSAVQQPVVSNTPPEVGNSSYGAGRLGGANNFIGNSLTNLLQRPLFSSANSTARSSAFIEGFQKYLKEQDQKTVYIDVTAIGGPDWAGALITNNPGYRNNNRLHRQAIVLLFTECCRRDFNKRYVSYLEAFSTKIRNAVRSIDLDIPIAQIILTTPEDYTVAYNNLASIYSRFLCSANTEEACVSTDSFRDYNVIISYKKDDYDNALAMYNPHKVRDRADLRITVSLSSNSNNTNVATSGPLACIGAYTTFIRTATNNGMIRYIPEVHISQISCLIPNQRILPFLLYIAHLVLIVNRHWVKQFSSLSGPESAKPNIGNLFKDPDNQNRPAFLTDINQVEQVIASYCEAPWLVLDYLDGRYHLPGLEAYALDPNTSRTFVNKLFDNFNASASGSNDIPGVIYARDMVGTAKLGKIDDKGVAVLSDTRYIDYLNTMVNYGGHNDLSIPESLLYHYSDIQTACDAVSQVMGTSSEAAPNFIYDRYLITLNGALTARVGESFSRNRILLPNERDLMTGTVNMNSIQNFASSLNMSNVPFGYNNSAVSGLESAIIDTNNLFA